ncbi:hypothetical protein JCM10908_004899 [Rhodotorula pacifica]|uniref:1-phosphatidylinositol 4-kinase n=1 Tax=Rhodotorula pacifica TaxID=1495444 RepID=UPI0031724D0D
MALERSGGSGSGLLLRLFESSFFDVHLAIGYLKTYSTSIGISHYLVNRLRSFEYEDVEFYWPQLCYLVITRTTPSNALENFILERCQEDSHIAVITLWYLQASLSELAQSPSSEQFGACRRLLNRVQEIIFTDPPVPTPGDSTPTDPLPTGSKRKINAPLASFVGIGVLLAAIGMPGLVNATGGMIIEQGRRPEQVVKSDEAGDIGMNGGEKGRADEGNSGSDEEDEEELLWDKPLEQASGTGKPQPKPPTLRSSSSATSVRSSTGKEAKKPKTPAKRSQTQPNYLPGDRIIASPRIPLSSAFESRSMSFLPSPLLSRATSKTGMASTGGTSTPSSKLAVADGGGGGPPALQRRASAASRLRPGAPPSLSVPSLPMSHSAGNLLGSPATTAHQLSGTTLPGYGLPKPFLSRLLLLQACRSQLDLLRSLQDISTRLVLVPKLARLSSLRAELTVLNHGLPRGCSLGMSTRSPIPSASAPPTLPAPTISAPSSPFEKPHPRTPRRKQARVIRISPSESVVLNSADRAPFVIYVEVLEEDLDFDPDRRSNWEDLRRALREREGIAAPPAGTSPNGDVHTPYLGSGQSGRVSVDSALDSYGKTLPVSPSKSDSRRGDALSASAPISPPPGTPFVERAEYALGSDLSTDPAAPAETEPPEPLGEMDLVEQLYGDISLRDDSAFPEQGEAEEVEIHNREADEAAWKRKDEMARRSRRRCSAASSGSASTTRSARHSISSVLNGGSHVDGTPSSPPPPRPKRKSSGGMARPGGRSIASRAPMSLDDYAERMRMAAIMLAQLDASQTASRGVVGAGTAAAGTLVTLPVATVAGVGGLVGYGLGAGLGAVKARLTKKETPVATAGQGGAGKLASLDTASAAEGTSAIAGQPPLNAQAASLSQHAAEAASVSGTAPSASAAVAGANGHSGAAAATLPTQRPRVLAPHDAAAIRERIMSEMMALEEERMERMRSDVQNRSYNASTGVAGKEDNTVVMRAVSKDDPSGAVFAESYTAKTARIRAASPFGHLPNWSLLSCIVKTGADLRQEQLAVQLISEFGRIWKEENCPGWVYYFRIMVTSENSGLIETINDSVSVHSLKKNAYARRAEDGTQVFDSYTLYDYFVETYGPITSTRYRKAQDALIESLAAYSVICYLLQLKDRHNGNILVDRDGHLIHIDFGFMLSNSPGSIGFEMAPFKLPQDYIDILGGFDSPKFGEFRTLFKQCFRDARKHAERIITLVELMQKDSKLPCFANGDLTSQQLRERFMLSLPQAQLDDYADKLILNSAQSSFTKLYDLFQSFSQGVL